MTPYKQYIWLALVVHEHDSMHNHLHDTHSWLSTALSADIRQTAKLANRTMYVQACTKYQRYNSWLQVQRVQALICQAVVATSVCRLSIACR